LGGGQNWSHIFMSSYPPVFDLSTVLFLIESQMCIISSVAIFMTMYRCCNARPLLPCTACIFDPVKKLSVTAAVNR